MAANGWRADDKGSRRRVGPRKSLHFAHAPRPERPRPGSIIGKLTTHVLDTAHGVPAAGMTLTLALAERDGRVLCSTTLGADGRPAAALLEGASLVAGRYRLVFAVGDYFRARGATLAEPPFLDHVPIEFAVADATADYHVPLLVSPWAYSTYRGS